MCSTLYLIIYLLLKLVHFSPEEQLASCETSNPILVRTLKTPLCEGVLKMRYHHVPNNNANKPGVCQPFSWKGCGGNANNFVSMEDCRNACTSNKIFINNSSKRMLLKFQMNLIVACLLN